MTGLFDSWQRQINYLRISVTDLCNLDCVYCSDGTMPHLLRTEILTCEEIERLVRAAAAMGISKVRLTGGEPLLRPDLSRLVAVINRIDGIDDISLTTNGTLLAKYAAELKEAGLNRVNISLDTLRAERFRGICRGGTLGDVLAGIEAARLNGLNPVKINMVVMRGVNDDEVVDFARKTVNESWNVRYIEFMPFGSALSPASAMVSAREIAGRIEVLGKLEPYSGEVGNGPARYYRLPGAGGTIGFITPVTEHFCQSCNRLRLTSDGQLRPCLLDEDEVNLKDTLRNGADIEEIKTLIQRAVDIKREHHQLSEGLPSAGRRPMGQIGG